MEQFEKQSYEEFTITADFSKNMETGETIADQSVLAFDKDGADASSIVTDQGTVAASGQTVKVLIQAGEQALAPYKITFRCTTSSGHKWELDVKMKVREL